MGRGLVPYMQCPASEAVTLHNAQPLHSLTTLQVTLSGGSGFFFDSSAILDIVGMIAILDTLGMHYSVLVGPCGHVAMH